jgi:RNA polymerase sigma-70 factor (ECF subfamily)
LAGINFALLKRRQVEAMPVDVLEPLGDSALGRSGPADHELLRALQEGDRYAATLLYRRYAKRLRQLIRAKCSSQLARRVDAEDIMQSVFHAFFRGATSGCYSVPKGEDLWPLLLVIALNKIRTQGSYHTAAKRDVRMTCGLEDTEALQRAVHRLEADEPLPFLQLIAQETLERLDPDKRDVVQLRMAGYEVEEIAQRLGRSKRTVERLLQACRHELTRMLTEPDQYAKPEVPPESVN